MADTKNTIVSKLNPYFDSGLLFTEGIKEVAKIAPKPPQYPTSYDIVNEINKFLDKKKLLGNDIDLISKETATIITSRAINDSLDFNAYLNKSNAPNTAKKYLNMLFNLVDTLRQGKNLYNYEHILEFTGELLEAITKLENEILSSGMNSDELILPLVAVSIEKSSIDYFKTIFDKRGTTVEETSFKRVLQISISGAVIGAIEAFKAKSSFNSIITGSVAGSIGASLNNTWGQELWLETSPPKLPLKH